MARGPIPPTLRAPPKGEPGGPDLSLRPLNTRSNGSKEGETKVMEKATESAKMAALFAAAAEYIRINGWLDDDAGFDGGPRSLDGAMNSVLEMVDPDVEKALRIGHDACRVFEDVMGADVCSWNDQFCRDASEAEGALRALASQLSETRQLVAA
jgi:hypothetical protein